MNEGIFKGCSSFEIKELQCNSFESEQSGNLQEVGICKVTCNGSNCNMDHNRPCVPTAGDDCDYTGGGGDTGGASVNILSLSLLLSLYFVI